jgi:hypothetical protein
VSSRFGIGEIENTTPHPIQLEMMKQEYQAHEMMTTKCCKISHINPMYCKENPEKINWTL